MYDYGEACPISRATSVFCERWTLKIIREMMLGVTRFSEFQKYLPKISPSLLNSRLRQQVDNGIISTLRTLSEIWWGDVGLQAAIAKDLLKVTGPPVYTRNLSKWFPISSFAGENKNFSNRDAKE